MEQEVGKAALDMSSQCQLAIGLIGYITVFWASLKNRRNAGGFKV